MEDHNIMDLFEMGVMVSIHSDDPSYFGGYINDNYIAVADAFDLDDYHIIELAKNSFKSAFIDDEMKDHYLGLIDDATASRKVY